MIIQTLPVTKLAPAEYNPRKDLKPGDPEYEKLKRSITEFGYVEPVVWNRTTGHVVGGHQRLKVLIDTGVKEVECVVVEMSEEKEKALNVALNKINGDWDKEKLSLLIADLQGADFDVSLTGFDAPELDALFKDAQRDGVHDDDFDVDAALKEPAFTKAGDLWILGKHMYFAKYSDCKSVNATDTITKAAVTIGYNRNTFEKRLNADVCELCGKTGAGKYEIHHVHKVKDLNGKELWERAMISKRRKTLVVCHECHQNIHHQKQ